MNAADSSMPQPITSYADAPTARSRPRARPTPTASSARRAASPWCSSCTSPPRWTTGTRASSIPSRRPATSSLSTTRASVHRPGGCRAPSRRWPTMRTHSSRRSGSRRSTSSRSQWAGDRPGSGAREPGLVRKLVLTGTGPRGGKNMDKVVGTTYWDVLRDPHPVGPQEVPVLQPQHRRQASGEGVPRPTARADERPRLPHLHARLPDAAARHPRLRPLRTVGPVHDDAAHSHRNPTTTAWCPPCFSEDLHRRIEGSEMIMYADSGHGGIFRSTMSSPRSLRVSSPA